jgi:hypothetical protein
MSRPSLPPPPPLTPHSRAGRAQGLRVPGSKVAGPQGTPGCARAACVFPPLPLAPKHRLRGAAAQHSPVRRQQQAGGALPLTLSWRSSACSCSRPAAWASPAALDTSAPHSSRACRKRPGCSSSSACSSA